MTASEKILLISNEFPPGPGGIGNHAYNLAKFLNKNGIKTDVLTVSDFATADQENEFDCRNSFSIHRHKRYQGRFKTYYRRLKEIRSKAGNGGYSHVIFSGRSSLLASLVIPKNKMKFVSIAHGGDVNAESLLERSAIDKALKRSDLIIPVSNFSASKISSSIDRDKIRIIPNGFDFDNIDSLKADKKSLTPGKLTLISVGTVWPRKGHHNVLNALPRLKELFPELAYHIVGRTADMTLVNKVMNDDLKPLVKIHGQIDNVSMQNLLNESDIFILLSETQKSGDFEGFGIAAIEANCFGLPAIGSRESGLEDAIKDGVSGVIVDPKNVEEIVSAVYAITANYESFSKGAVNWAQQHHWSRIIKTYMESIRGIAG